MNSGVWESHDGNLFRARGELAVLRNDAELFLARKRLFAQFVPALIELALVLVGPFFGNVVRRVRRAGREVHEERLVAGEQPLLTHPVDRAIRHVLHEVVALFGRLRRLHDFRAFVNRRDTIDWSRPRRNRRSIRSPIPSASDRTARPGSLPIPGPRGTCRTARSSSR